MPKIKGSATAVVKRRMGGDNAKNRALLIDAAQQLLSEEGHAAVTTRRVATKAGLKMQLIFYYFHSMNDLVLAAVRKNTAKRLQHFAQAMASPEPFRALWELTIHPCGSIPTSELMALADHREAIRTEVVAAAKQFRDLQIEAVSRLLAIKGIDQNAYPAAGIVTIVAAVARALLQDSALGIPDGYAEAVKLMERQLEFFAIGNRPVILGRANNFPRPDKPGHGKRTER